MMELILRNYYFNPFYGKAFADIYRLKSYLEFIHEGRTFDCTQSNQKFKYNHLLQQHIQTIHEGEKNIITKIL